MGFRVHVVCWFGGHGPAVSTKEGREHISDSKFLLPLSMERTAAQLPIAERRETKGDTSAHGCLPLLCVVGSDALTSSQCQMR